MKRAVGRRQVGARAARAQRVAQRNGPNEWEGDASHRRRMLRAPILRGMTYVIVEPCIGTKNASCVDVCPVSCIYEAEDMYYINPDECIECGACEPECPVNAIFHESAVPDEWKNFIQRNRELSGLS